jgi:hypothetical protein
VTYLVNRFLNRIRPDWPQALRAILDTARRRGSKGLLAFDLDSTVFDNRPRQARIVREFGQEKGIPALLSCKPEYFDSGWDVKAAMRNCGLPDAETESLQPEFRAFWLDRFFTSEYCIEDVPVRGAADFTRAAAATGARVCYVTGRPERMRSGTLETMHRWEMPQPGNNIHLIMKPTFEMNDGEFKREAHAQLNRLGDVIAAFDNEPLHVNDYKRQFPNATVVHLATDDSGRPVELLDEVISVPYFTVVVETTGVPSS